MSDKARGFRVARGGSGKGYHLTATIARLDVADAGGGKVKLTLQVKLSVATWPENNLRHVMSAKASAKVPSSGITSTDATSRGITNFLIGSAPSA